MSWMPKAIVIWLLCWASAQAGLARLEAIGMIESGNNDRAVGSAGEVSQYQILPQVWRRYSSSRAYANLEVSRQVAWKHLAYLEASFRKRAGRAPTDFDCYVMWNGGLTYYAKIGFRAARVHPTISERAQRFVNLCTRETEGEGTTGILAVGGGQP
jgi:hypothetical protein